MSIVVDNSVAGSDATSQQSLSLLVSGSDRLLLAAGQDTTSSGGGTDVTSMTYNGVSVSMIGNIYRTAGRQTSMWYQNDPSTGTNNLLINKSPSGYSGFTAVSYTGAKSQAPTESTTGQGQGSTYAESLVVSAGTHRVMMGYTADYGISSAGSDTTFDRNDIAYGICASDTTIDNATATLNLNTSHGSNWTASIIASFEEAASSTDYPLTASVGAFTLTGVASAFSKASEMIASAGSFVMTGIAVTLLAGASLTASVGSFVLTGTNTAFSKVVSLTASAGSFIWTGLSVTLTAPLKLLASVGSFVLTGVDARLRSSNIVKNVGKFVASVKNKDRS